MYKGYEVIIEPNDEGGFYARIPDIPSIFTGGKTEEDALKNAKDDAVKEYLKVCKEDGVPPYQRDMPPAMFLTFE